MRAHVLQHVPFEGLGSIEDWLNQHQATTTWTRFYQSAALPSVEDVDLLIALGGPMSVNDTQELPWLVEEKKFVAAAIRAGKSVLGICLGAQLIASALGQRVYPGPNKEIGWFPIQATTGAPGSFAFPATCDVFHWHGETFDLPDGAVQLARSTGCEHQAFQLGPRCIGLQFHLETTPVSAEAIITHCRHEVVVGRYVQSEVDMLSTGVERYAGINRLMTEVLEYLTRPDQLI